MLIHIVWKKRVPPELRWTHPVILEHELDGEVQDQIDDQDHQISHDDVPPPTTTSIEQLGKGAKYKKKSVTFVTLWSDPPREV